MKYTIDKLSRPEVLSMLKACNNSFSPPLSDNIPYTLEEYANKLSTYATFVLVKDNGESIGFLAYYTNIESAFVYIPQLWVSDIHQRKGVGAKMLEILIDNISTEIKSVRLEVRKSNDKAVSFYYKMGFSVINDEGNKCMLEKLIG